MKPLQLMLLLLLYGCTKPQPEIILFAAASTTDVLTQLANNYTEESGVRVRTSFAASSVLARQIERGARADLFLSANPSWMEYLEEAGSLQPGTRVELLSNQLVLVTSNPQQVFSDWPSFCSNFKGKLALADPSHVPAGIYATQSLEYLGFLPTRTNQLMTALDVRHALLLAELGEADAALVYATDANGSNRVRILAQMAPNTHDQVLYPLALSHNATSEARAFYSYLLGEKAAAVFRQHGFTFMIQ